MHAPALRRSRRALLPALLLSLTACAGPKAPLQVGIRELPSKVVLGDRTAHLRAPASAPVPPVALPLVPEQIRELQGGALTPREPSAPAAIQAAPSPESCPSTSPGTVSPADAPDSFKYPPAEARYGYTASGSYELSGPDAGSGRLPDTSARTVRDVVRLPGSTPTYRFVVDAELGTLLTSTTYTLVPTATPTSTPVNTAPGLYITRITGRNVDGTTTSFTPANSPGLLLLPFPATPGTSLTQSGVDPATGTLLSYTATVGQRRGVSACGTVLGAIPVHLDGSVGPSGGEVSPSGSDAFTADYDIGTAFGGLSLRDAVSIQRTSASSGFVQKSTAAISRRPEPPSTTPSPCSSPCTP